MILHRIDDWDDAYSNGPNIPQGERWPAAWVEPARAYAAGLVGEGRAKLDITYGDRPRNTMDLFLPQGAPKGLIVFVHGGFWHRLDKSLWSHLAKGCVDNGFAVAIPSYTLCPEARISDITVEIGRAIERAADILPGPIRLAGHSAGGHLVTRMITTTAPLSPAVQARIEHVVSVSGLHDLRPLIKLAMNRILRIDAAEAETESPVLLAPMPHARLTCWVGAAERSEFLRQNGLLANIWVGLGATTAVVEQPDRHHFNILDGLSDADHPITKALLYS